MADSGCLLQVALQHVGEQLAGGELHRVPAQRLAQLRHRHPHQRARVALTHLPAGHKPSNPRNRAIWLRLCHIYTNDNGGASSIIGAIFSSRSDERGAIDWACAKEPRLTDNVYVV